MDQARLRMYERSKLRYYYAVVVCDGVPTAAHLYRECDGLEFELTANRCALGYLPLHGLPFLGTKPFKGVTLACGYGGDMPGVGANALMRQAAAWCTTLHTSTAGCCCAATNCGDVMTGCSVSFSQQVGAAAPQPKWSWQLTSLIRRPPARRLDLRFVPEGQSFEGRQVRDEAAGVPAGYEPPPAFATAALQHTAVKLTWDAEPAERRRALSRRVTAEQLRDDDFKVGGTSQVQVLLEWVLGFPVLGLGG